MGLVLKEKQPVFLAFFCLYLDLNAASVDFLRFVQIFQLSLCFQIFGEDGSHIHETDGLRPSQFLPHVEIFLVGIRKQFVRKGNVVYGSQKCGMSAMIRPIGVDQLYFRNRRLAVFCREVFLTELYIIDIHGKTSFLDKLRKLCLGHGSKSPNRLHRLRQIVFHFQGLKGIERSFSCFHGVDNIALDFLDFFLRKLSFEQIYLCGAQDRSFPLRNDLYALRRGICSLVELSRQIFCGKDVIACGIQTVRNDVKLRLREHCFFRRFK